MFVQPLALNIIFPQSPNTRTNKLSPYGVAIIADKCLNIKKNLYFYFSLLYNITRLHGENGSKTISSNFPDKLNIEVRTKVKVWSYNDFYPKREEKEKKKNW